MLPHYLTSHRLVPAFLLEITDMARIIEEAKGIKSDFIESKEEINKLKRDIVKKRAVYKLIALVQWPDNPAPH